MRFLTPADLRGLTPGALEDLLGRTELLVVVGDGEIAEVGLAALLFADYAVLDRNATLILGDEPRVWTAAKWRIGRGALRLLLDGGRRLSADEAFSLGLADELIDSDAEEWRARWMRNRSALALDTAATLIRARGGDALERAAFTHLFAMGEPQKGLAAFLEKRKPPF